MTILEREIQKSSVTLDTKYVTIYIVFEFSTSHKFLQALWAAIWQVFFGIIKENGWINKPQSLLLDSVGGHDSYSM